MTKEEKQCLLKINKLRSTLQADNDKIRTNDLSFYHNNVGKSTNELIERDSTDEHYGKLLFNLIRKFKSKNCLELGTCLGISSAYIKSAQQLNGGGKLISLEGIDKRAMIAKNNLEDLGFNGFGIIIGQFKDTLSPALQNHGKFDFVFIDGHHKLEPTLDYFGTITPFLEKDALVIIDDLDLTDDMEKAWSMIKEDQNISNHQRLGKWGLLKIK